MAQPDAEVAWPEVGETYFDVKSAGRTLVVTEVRRKDGLGRNIIGKVDGADYACDMLIFTAVWRKHVIS